ncbi:hypothetical protein HZS61_011429 [Fusarium oxysporum f. sp. conglutinans]|uniref:Uncharacterized protein n=1 Tax=Fusarium oxysporum f. sp. conglutinans TaxID=100902 RepID=A0A8H6LMJ4_FUSOX|nr:hypothetical protein HZS61_011429 [Fusarium oxysporum f. sp. conglutinans]
MHLLLPTLWKNNDNPKIVLVGSGIRNRPKSRLLVDAEDTRPEFVGNILGFRPRNSSNGSNMTTNSWHVTNAPVPTGSAASAA